MRGKGTEDAGDAGGVGASTGGKKDLEQRGKKSRAREMQAKHRGARACMY